MIRRDVLIGMAALTPLARAAMPASCLHEGPKRIMATGLSSPVGTAFDNQGRLLIANWSAGSVIRIARNAQISILATGLQGPSGLAVAPNGDIFVASYSGDIIWKITMKGSPEVFAWGLATPAGLSFDRSGRLLIANRRTNQILVADATGGLSVAVEGDLQTPVGAAQLADGTYFVSNINGGIAYAGADGRARTISRDLVQPGPGIVVAGPDSVFVVDYGGTEVKQVFKDGRTCVIANGFKSPVGLALSAERNMVVADWGTNAAYGMLLGNP
jgi:DNA-binding beta-propeller fold protein YncE